MNERYIKWYTPYLSCEFEMLVFGEKSGLPLILFPTSGACYYENKDFGLVGAVAWYIKNGKVTVYCPDAIDQQSFYNKSIHPADRMRTTTRLRTSLFATCSTSRGANAVDTASRFAARASALTTPQTSRSVIRTRSVISSA